MSSQLNKAQQQAIDTIGQNVIVSAGAGSGKTSVLTARVVKLIASGTSIDHLLVVTFTEAAATEMKNRIRKSLLDLKRYDEAARLESSRIMTFDAFALSLVTKYHYYLGLEPSIGILAAPLLRLLRKKMIDEVLNDFYDNPTPSFKTLIHQYAFRSDTKIRNFINDILSMLDLKIDDETYLANYLNRFFDDEYIEGIIHKYLDLVHRDMAELTTLARQLEHEKLVEAVTIPLLALNNIDNWDELINEINNFSFIRKPPKISACDSDLVDEIKSIFKKIKIYAEVGTLTAIKNNYLGTKSNVAVLVEIVRQVQKRLNEYKYHYQKFGFSDISKLALRLVELEDVKSELLQEIRYIMIDEYQDTNDVQDYFMMTLANHNLFMVGDIKQSIYRFRNANCELFMQKYHDYSASSTSQKIDMNTNYRSRSEVIDAINMIFTRLMNESIGNANYAATHMIQFGNHLSYDHNHDKDSPIGLNVYPYEVSDDEPAAISEIHIIAKDILTKITNGHRVQKGQSMRPACYNDFAILIDRKTRFTDFKAIFHDYGIPLEADIGDDFDDDDVFNVFKNLIRLVAGATNPNFIDKYRHELMSVWRSFLCGYDDQTIYETLQSNGLINADQIVRRIKELAMMSLESSLGQQLETIALTFRLHEAVIHIGDVSKHHAKIEQLIMLGREMETLDFTILDFVTYFDEIEQFQQPPEFVGHHFSGPAVQLMTIHKSKGLEFPIVYYAGLHHKFNFKDVDKPFIADRNFGILLPIIAEKQPCSAFHYLYKDSERQASLSEEMRKLYVAFTRAKELMIVLRQDRSNQQPKPIEASNSLSDFLDHADLNRFPHFTLSKDPLKKTDTIKEKAMQVTFQHLDIKSSTRGSERPSMTDGEVNYEAVSLGNTLHDVMSRLDYKQPDLSFISDEALRQRLERMLALAPFKDANIAKCYQEYPFYDHVAHLSGVIDLMFEFDNEIRIIDLKTSAIDRVDYARQLCVYGRFVRQLTKKKIRLFLVSMWQCRFQEIPDEEC